ncbi:MAG: tetratricopeptide repeat protein [Nitrospinae bacterium]|nr:tetratricopeptide repeat protein [Nitrospinota bacterium]
MIVENLLIKFSGEPIYIDMRGSSTNPLSPEEVMILVINLLCPSEKFPETESKRTHLYTALLQRRKVILFLDNVPDSHTLKCLLPPKNCALVVTSVKPLAVPHLISKKLNLLDTVDAQNLLLKITPRTGFWANEISSMCSNFPLALVLAGQHVATYHNKDCAKLVEFMRHGLKQLKSKPGDETKKSVDVVLNTSYRSLSETAAAVLRKLVLFPESFDRKAANFLCEDPENEHLVNLLSLGLISHNDETSRFYFHHQVRRFLMARLKEAEPPLVEKRFVTYFLTVMIAAGEFYAQDGKDRDQGLNLFDLEWENIKKGWAWTNANSEKDKEADNLCLSYTEAGVSLLVHRKSSAERLQWFEAALGSARRLNESEAEGKYLLLLGIEHNRLNQGEEALEHLEDALKLSNQSEDKTMERKVLGQLGLAHQALGKSHQAIEFLEKELELYKISGETEGKEYVLENLGRVYLKVDESNRAIEYYKMELNLVEEREDEKRQGRILRDLGDIYISQGDHASAIEYFDKGLDLVRNFKDKRGEIILLGKLGEAYTGAEKFKKALTFYQQALALAQVLKDRKNAALMAEQMGHCYLNSGNHREAINNYQKALVVYQKAGDKVREGETLWNLALATRQSEKIPDAIQLAEKALDLYRKIKRLNSDTRQTIEKQLKEWQEFTGVEASGDAEEKPAPQRGEEPATREETPG